MNYTFIFSIAVAYWKLQYWTRILGTYFYNKAGFEVRFLITIAPLRQDLQVFITIAPLRQDLQVF
jgi:hypothetical protein